MGTSKQFGGPSGKTPLVPSWLDGADQPSAASQQGDPQADSGTPNANATEPTGNERTDSQPFRAARTNFSKYVRSGGSDTRSLRRALQQYVTRSSGGSRNAAKKMGASIGAGGAFFDALERIRTDGLDQTLRYFNRQNLIGKDAAEIMLSLIDVVCPAGGRIDEGIAREAFVETVLQLNELGITDLDALTPDQVDELMLKYLCLTLELRLANEIGTRGLALPTRERDVQKVMQGLTDFIEDALRLALKNDFKELRGIARDKLTERMESVYDAAWQQLGSLEENE